MIFMVLAYLLGSISSAILVCKGLGLGDPRDQGSGNPGATNVLRLAGKKAAILVLICDLLKGTIAVSFAKVFGITAFEASLVAIAAVLGHMYPLFFRFKGGKGVATALGALIAIDFFVGLLVVVTWAIVAKIWKYSSLSALVAICLAPIFAAMIVSPYDFLPLCVLAALIVYRHRDNIERLRAGTEPKIGAERSFE